MPKKKEYPYEEAEEFKTRFSFFHPTIRFRIILRVEDQSFEMEGKLFPLKAPITVKNFVQLVNKGFYNGLKIHRMVKNKLMQTGDPTGTGMGGSKKKIFGEFRRNDYTRNDLQNLTGALGMARMEHDLNSATSQFYIILDYQMKFNGEYAVFGYLDKNKNDLYKINKLVHTTKKDVPKTDIIVDKIEILDERVADL